MGPGVQLRVPSEAGVGGPGGKISLTAPELLVTGGGRIDSSSLTPGEGGSIEITSGSIVVTGAGSGIATRAGAENERFTTLLGFNADFQAGVSWVLASVLAGLVGILVAPITGVTPNFFTVLLISSLGAALP